METLMENQISTGSSSIKSPLANKIVIYSWECVDLQAVVASGGSGTSKLPQPRPHYGNGSEVGWAVQGIPCVSDTALRPLNCGQQST